MNLKIIIGLASFLAIVHSTLSVVSSSESTISLEQQGLLNISYSVANFGFAP